MTKIYMIERIDEVSGLFLGSLKDEPTRLGMVAYPQAIKFADEKSASKMLHYLKLDKAWLIKEVIG